jgi:hypothetical protein
MSGKCRESRGSKSVLYPAHPDTETAVQAGCSPAFANNPELQRQLDWGNGNALEYVDAVRDGETLDPKGPQLFPDLVGTCEYYDARHADFQRRNPDLEPPDYYLNYGKKYCDRFSEDTFPGLSGAGQEWDIKTRTNLQLAMEMGVLTGQEDFSQIEANPEEFLRFAFESHPSAYLDGGLADLPVNDLVMIGMTPDLSDLATQDGVSQIIATSERMVPEVALDTAVSVNNSEIPSWADLDRGASPKAEVDARGATLEDAIDLATLQTGVKMLEVGTAIQNPTADAPDLYPGRQTSPPAE